MENNVKIAVDTGASGTKVVCSVNGDDPYAFLISPYITKVDEPKKLIRDVGFDKDNLWVKMGKDYYAVGSLAERYGASQLIKPQKFITAPSKICASDWTSDADVRNLFRICIIIELCFATSGTR